MRLRDRLAAVHPAPPPADKDARDTLERSLLDALPPERVSPWRRRVLLGGLAGLAFAGACVAPAEYSMDFGLRLAFRVDDHHFDPRVLSEHLRTHFDGIDELRISASQSVKTTDDGHTTSEFDVVVEVVGTVDEQEVELSLLDHFDALAPVDIDVDAIGGTVQGTLGGMVSHKALGWELDTGGVDAARARILEEFAARGLPPPSRVDVEIREHDAAGRHEREVRVEIEADTPP